MIRLSHIKGLLAIFLVLMFFQTAAAQVPQIMNYEGTLTDTDGNPVPDGTYEIQFSLYSVLTGGTPLWTEAWNNTTVPVIVTNGKFNTLLGTHNPIPEEFFSGKPETYIGIKVGTDDEMLPRQQLASVPYAFSAGLSRLPLGALALYDSGSIKGTTAWKAVNGGSKLVLLSKTLDLKKDSVVVLLGEGRAKASDTYRSWMHFVCPQYPDGTPPDNYFFDCLGSGINTFETSVMTYGVFKINIDGNYQFDLEISKEGSSAHTLSTRYESFCYLVFSR
ncbi:hypothetical protein QUF75_20080 [Desulfococcaceae bacterium HSG7]|nr:hypothetical protein [Desulfococcaceae bacterium HSG7]